MKDFALFFTKTPTDVGFNYDWKSFYYTNIEKTEKENFINFVLNSDSQFWKISHDDVDIVCTIYFFWEILKIKGI